MKPSLRNLFMKKMTARQQALKLQRPLPDGALRTVARGEKKDKERKLVTEGY